MFENYFVLKNFSVFYMMEDDEFYTSDYVVSIFNNKIIINIEIIEHIIDDYTYEYKVPLDVILNFFSKYDVRQEINFDDFYKFAEEIFDDVLIHLDLPEIFFSTSGKSHSVSILAGSLIQFSLLFNMMRESEGDNEIYEKECRTRKYPNTAINYWWIEDRILDTNKHLHEESEVEDDSFIIDNMCHASQ